MGLQLRRGFGVSGAIMVAVLLSSCVQQEVRQVGDTPEAVVETVATLQGGSPEVLVVGDSQISVAAGPFYQSLFKNFNTICRAHNVSVPNTSINFSKVASIGVRSTGLQSWTTRADASKKTICEVDKNFGVNAGTWGLGGTQGRKFVQIGKGEEYQFCRPNLSAFEAMFAKDYYKPKLLVMAFLGNSAERWANTRSGATIDVKETLEQIPDDTACVFMTTAPVFSKETNDLRARAQENVISAFQNHKTRCAVVPGFSKDLRDKIEGNSQYFRTNAEGRVIDPLHPNEGAIKHFFEKNTPVLCRAISQQLNGKFLN